MTALKYYHLPTVSFIPTRKVVSFSDNITIGEQHGTKYQCYALNGLHLENHVAQQPLNPNAIVVSNERLHLKLVGMTATTLYFTCDALPECSVVGVPISAGWGTLVNFNKTAVTVTWVYALMNILRLQQPVRNNVKAYPVPLLEDQFNTLVKKGVVIEKGPNPYHLVRSSDIPSWHLMLKAYNGKPTRNVVMIPSGENNQVAKRSVLFFGSKTLINNESDSYHLVQKQKVPVTLEHARFALSTLDEAYVEAIKCFKAEWDLSVLTASELCRKLPSVRYLKSQRTPDYYTVMPVDSFLDHPCSVHHHSNAMAAMEEVRDHMDITLLSLEPRLTTICAQLSKVGKRYEFELINNAFIVEHSHSAKSFIDLILLLREVENICQNRYLTNLYLPVCVVEDRSGEYIIYPKSYRSIRIDLEDVTDAEA